MQVKKQQLEPDMEEMNGSKLGQEYVKAAYCHPSYLTSMENTSCKMLDLMKHKLESRFLGEISITSDMQMAPLLGQKEAGLKLSTQKRRSWHLVPSIHGKINGETMEAVRDFIFLAPKSLDGDCSHEIKRYLLLRRKVMTNLDSVLKSKDINLPTKIHIVKAMLFLVVMYGCESWTIKKAE